MVIIFPEGGATLTETANRQLDVAARLYRDANPILMTVAGYTDSRGDEYSNLLLSARRARAVRQGLIARGLPADRLLIQAFGQSEPADPGDPLTAANRRAVVTWQLPGAPARG
ncbi:MAG: OmpA family protein [Stellaceae bacterium]